MKEIKLEEAVRIFAGIMVLISAALVCLISKWWLLLTVFIGLNLIQSAFSGFCPAELLFKKMGVKE